MYSSDNVPLMSVKTSNFLCVALGDSMIELMSLAKMNDTQTDEYH
jgi:hypothetical protein